MVAYHAMCRLSNFYPRSPCGERLKAIATVTDKEDFYPRSPCGERLQVAPQAPSITGISIHALLAESDKEAEAYIAKLEAISIHALLAESDLQARCDLRRNVGISIHALLAESDSIFL